MQSIKLSQEPKPKRKSAQLNVSENRQVSEKDDLLDLFPLPRYFQIHFQHVHTNVDDVQTELTRLKKHISDIEKKLDLFLAILKNHPGYEQNKID